MARSKIHECTTVRSGYLTRSGIELEVEGSHFLLQIRDFADDRRQINRAGLIRFSPGKVAEGACLRSGDVVFLAKGSRHFAAVVEDLPSPCLAASYFFVLRPNSGVQAEYLAWVLNQDPAQKHFSRMATAGAHMPVIRKEVIENLEIALPDLATQKRIIKIDALARQQQALLTELAEKKNLLATAACRQAAEQDLS